MSLLKKDLKKKPLTSLSRGGTTGMGCALRPQRVEKLAPCTDTCEAGTRVRDWLVTLAQRERMGLSEDAAFSRAFGILAQHSPFPAVMGRICPHPCETGCNRTLKEGPVAVNAMERFLGDWALAQKLPLPRLETDPKPESIGVIGAGPAGLSFAYQMARRSYPVTVYEKYEKPGGMLAYGIPSYRLPPEVLAREIQRILDLGVRLELGIVVGRDVTVAELRRRHQVLFLGIGAHKGKLLRIPGEAGPGLFTGTEYLNLVNRGQTVDLGKRVAVIGGGDTAVDAARAARRSGAEVTIFYRRTRVEIPAIASEIEAAFQEQVRLELLVAPVELKREAGKLTALVLQKMELGEPDESGRRRPVPVPGSEFAVAADSVIAAVSQVPDWSPLSELNPEGKWIQADAGGKLADGVWTGGDVLDLKLAGTAIFHGRRAAESVHAALRGQAAPASRPSAPRLPPERLKLAWYAAKPRVERAQRPAAEWLAKPNLEIDLGITRAQFLEEASRCLSCGQCFGCERCWMYCTPNAVAKVEPSSAGPGNFYKFKLELCDGCKKCADECPCGVLDMV